MNPTNKKILIYYNTVKNKMEISSHFDDDLTYRILEGELIKLKEKLNY